MKWIEKVRQMDVNEMAKFIVGSDRYDGFRDQACKKCPMYGGRCECYSKDLDADCKIAVKNLLESEVDENACH